MNKENQNTFEAKATSYYARKERERLDFEDTTNSIYRLLRLAPIDLSDLEPGDALKIDETEVKILANEDGFLTLQSHRWGELDWHVENPMGVDKIIYRQSILRQ